MNQQTRLSARDELQGQAKKRTNLISWFPVDEN
jgi:hypothetical protein